eukprot:scaffold116337_cov32-Tisochrysis_lutea.AAC.3
MARQILIGHLDHPEAATVSQKKPWSWKVWRLQTLAHVLAPGCLSMRSIGCMQVVCGANPAYDTFPAQHQVFYPSERSAAAIWYDPVFKVETLDGRQVSTSRIWYGVVRCNDVGLFRCSASLSSARSRERPAGSIYASIAAP